MRQLARFLVALLFLALAACSAPPPDGQGGPEALARALVALGPEVDPEEARRAAEIAYAYPLQLKEEWQVTDPPLVHNFKVLEGIREKGLCNDWARAMLERLREEQFETLSLHWSTSPPEGFRVIHHSAVISARGGTLYDGIVLDPWRWGGVLYWSADEDDPRYEWGPPI
ncbi:hypothetical protein FIU97_14365 [Roseivivax sp. THAF40]|uniref:hypothetical protein n=1 Tax=unclassified Roseivivax TaxID=2639302 RepID=UPI0012690C1E|nr:MULTISPECIES: hypothetical protein [unclassified Roseivivax]QFS83930.1 hypothetical protein FIV09_13925 [Roseivivax sp. THAF197b]QFT47762.1 hypothetical protein FIU97_14365 [Roseivivax sp. THAF40]